ncbi:MAG: signal peptidase II [Clostridia bacterium]|nr:signal peptidase II [Clostridia bacterium]
MSVVVSLLSIAVLTVIDQVIKYFIEKDLRPVHEIPFIDGFLHWEYVQNTGAAFGSFSNSTTLLSIITGAIILCGIIAIIIKKINHKFLLVTSVMIISGGLGNLIDRIIRGYVVDFICVEFIDFPVFNFADILVTCGAFLLIGYLLFDIYKDKKIKGDNVG